MIFVLYDGLFRNYFLSKLKQNTFIHTQLFCRIFVVYILQYYDGDIHGFCFLTLFQEILFEYYIENWFYSTFLSNNTLTHKSDCIVFRFLTYRRQLDSNKRPFKRNGLRLNRLVKTKFILHMFAQTYLQNQYFFHWFYK